MTLSAFDGRTQIWLDRISKQTIKKDRYGDEFTLSAPIVRCPLCGRGIRGEGSELAENCPHNRIGGALPCPMAVSHAAEVRA
jgi:hypothetical protein